MQARVRLPEVALVEALVEVFEHPHAGDAVEGRSAREHQLVASRRADEVADDVEEDVFEEELRGRCSVEPLARRLRMPGILDLQYGIWVPQVLARHGRSEDVREGLRVGI